jgi:hypothetical protein
MILVNEEENLDSVVTEINKRLPHLEAMRKFDNLLNGLTDILNGIRSSSANNQQYLSNKLNTIRGKINGLQRY